MKKLTKILFLLLISLSLWGCSIPTKESLYTNVSGFYFDTYISINIYDSVDQSVLSELNEKLARYDNLFSEDNEKSDIYRLNHSVTPQILDPETIHVLENALYFSELTSGRFDPSIQSVQDLWTFDGTNNTPPQEQAIKNALPHVDYSSISISGNNVSLSPGQQITLGASAKGYIADQIKSFLLKNNINNALIDLGGNILCMGSKTPDIKDSDRQKVFEIGIKQPFSKDTARVLSTTNISVVTSGVYERSYTYQNVLYHHILDTKTGYPVSLVSENGKKLYSVTVIGPSSEICDNLSTSILILGETEGTQLLSHFPDYQAMFIYNDQSISTTTDFETVLKRTDYKTKIMCLGDSITYGYCPGYPEGGYRNTLSQLLTDSGQESAYDFVGSINAGSGYDNDCCGYSGYTIETYIPNDTNEKGRPGLDTILIPELSACQPDIIILMIGTNDILLMNQPETINHRLDMLIEKIIKNDDNLKELYICTIPYINTGYIGVSSYSQTDLDDYINQFNTHIKKCYSSANINGITINTIDVNAELTHGNLIDGIHPAPDGYNKIGKLIYTHCFSEQ